MNSTTKPNSPEPEPPKRRWLRFRLRTLLVLVTLVCVWLGWYMMQVHKQRQVVATLEKYNAKISYYAFYTFPPWNQILPRWLILNLNESLTSNDLRRATSVTIQSAGLAENDLPSSRTCPI